MPGAAAAVGIVGGTALLLVGLAAAGSAAAFSQRVAATADAAALAAADAASGAITGVPCERAEQIAGATGIRLSACDLDGLVATVTVSSLFGMLPAEASARAGPPS